MPDWKGLTKEEWLMFRRGSRPISMSMDFQGRPADLCLLCFCITTNSRLMPYGSVSPPTAGLRRCAWIERLGLCDNDQCCLSLQGGGLLPGIVLRANLCGHGLERIGLQSLGCIRCRVWLKCGCMMPHWC